MPYVREALPEEHPSGAPEDVELEHLIRFFEHPVRYFFQRRLGLFLGAEAPSVEDREPIELDALERWQAGDALLRYRNEGIEPTLARALVRAADTLPPGAPGDVEEERAAAGVESLLREVQQLRAGEPLPDLAVDGTLGAGRWRLVGQVHALWPAGHIALQYSKLPHRRELGLWIRHAR